VRSLTQALPVAEEEELDVGTAFEETPRRRGDDLGADPARVSEGYR
jgi:hypothetical protein